jgi:hypothetical protein
MNYPFKITDPKNQIKWMCYDVFITTDNKVLNQRFELLKERLNGGSYGFTVNKKFRTKTWIRRNCINVHGCIEF